MKNSATKDDWLKEQKKQMMPDKSAIVTELLDEAWDAAGYRFKTDDKAEACNAKAWAHVKDFKYTNAKAEAGVGKAEYKVSLTPTQYSAEASAEGPNAAASAALVEGLWDASAKVSAGKAEASADFGTKNLGALAKAEAVAGRAEIGIRNTPLHAHAQGPSVGAEAGISWDYTGANVGGSLGELKAGPFAIRAGLKFGKGIRNGVPEIDLGPVTVPTPF